MLSLLQTLGDHIRQGGYRQQQQQQIPHPLSVHSKAQTPMYVLEKVGGADGRPPTLEEAMGNPSVSLPNACHPSCSSLKLPEGIKEEGDGIPLPAAISAPKIRLPNRGSKSKANCQGRGSQGAQPRLPAGAHGFRQLHLTWPHTFVALPATKAATHDIPSSAGLTVCLSLPPQLDALCSSGYPFLERHRSSSDSRNACIFL